MIPHRAPGYCQVSLIPGSPLRPLGSHPPPARSGAAGGAVVAVGTKRKAATMTGGTSSAACTSNRQGGGGSGGDDLNGSIIGELGDGLGKVCVGW